MNGHGNSIEPMREQQPTDLVIETGAPEEFGFPENPSMHEYQCWHNQERVLGAIRKTGTMHSAAEAAGLSIWALDKWVRTDKYGFKKRRELALQVYQDMLDAEIDRRAVEGIDKSIYYKGEKVDTVKEYSDNLLMFRRKKLDPSYRDNYTPTVNPQDIKVTSITFNFPPGFQPPPGSQWPARKPVPEAEVRELPEGNDGNG